ncbi:hypothetical protein [Erythrobacter sp. WG]|uniref:hypothetical protein n=1 Tax=Erythrobacter sp. WG TaxID=2985510 RepID=UPI00226EE7DE|nr:hypothetical protein [Erythrobacter sp. WG]MCX9145833.1 hypothetical protein [Erythrobacter sp. WG]
MDQVATYAEAMARHRGYPDPTCAMIARHVVFLERRGLLGLSNLYWEMTSFPEESLDDRFNVKRPDGHEGGHCPFSAAIGLWPSYDWLTSIEPEDRRWAIAPSHALLAVPTLAEWLRPTGRRAMFWWAKDGAVPGYIVVEGFRLAAYLKTSGPDPWLALTYADHIGFSDCPDDILPTPEPRSGFLEKIQLAPRHIEMMETFLAGDR